MRICLRQSLTVVAALLAGICATAACAHSASDAYLTLSTDRPGGPAT